MRTPTEPIRIVHLEDGQLLNLDAGREGLVRVLQGQAWLTEEGQSRDTFLQTGGEACVRGRRIVVQAQGGQGLQISLRTAVPRRTRATWLCLHSWARRWQFGPTVHADT